jgi:inorganic pyrophosphatase
MDDFLTRDQCINGGIVAEGSELPAPIIIVGTAIVGRPHSLAVLTGAPFCCIPPQLTWVQQDVLGDGLSRSSRHMTHHCCPHFICPLCRGTLEAWPTPSTPGDTVLASVPCSGLIFSIFLLRQVAAVLLDVTSAPGAARTADSNEQNAKLVELYQAITLGASSFLHAEYRLCAIFVVVVSGGITVLISWATKDESGAWVWANGIMSAVSFAVGAITSIISGFIGMRVAVFANARCTVGACAPAPQGWTHSFNTAFRAGGVMGFSLTGVALLSLFFLILGLRPFFADSEVGTLRLMECIAGFGLGGSSIAMFGRVGGGIYTKAADVGADLAGKVRASAGARDPARDPGDGTHRAPPLTHGV